jgi:hypothetical protein
VNINQAKSITGFTGSIAGRAGIKALDRHCKSALVDARKAGDDIRERQITEAWQVVKKRSRGNFCDECGARINRNATHCQLHSSRRQKALPLGNRTWFNSAESLITDPKPAKQPPLDISWPQGGVLAHLGYFTPQVQKIVARWIPEIGHEQTENYFHVLARAVIYGAALNLPEKSRWEAIWELGQAISSVYNNTTEPPAWLMRLRRGTLKNGKAAQSWADIAKEIKSRGGPSFTPNSIKGHATRMRLRRG